MYSNFILFTIFFSRANFFVRKFSERYELGNPFAGNFYQAQYDENVPKFRESMRKK